MLPAAARLRRPAEFAAATRSGAKAGSRVCSVHVASRASGESPRVGFVVSRQVGPAVVRNQVRRRLRHLMRARLASLPPTVDVVVRAHPVAATVSSPALAAELDRALARALAHKPVVA